MGIKQGKPKHWRPATVLYILKNEKYIGDSLVQKNYTTDEFPFRRVRNDGQVDKFYIKNSHSAIISLETFEAVQNLLAQKSIIHAPKTNMQHFPLSKMIKCGVCGSAFHRRNNDRGVRWMCYQHLKSKDFCKMKAITQNEIYQMFLRVYNKLLDNKENILSVMLNQMVELRGKAIFTRPDIMALNEKISDLVKQNHSLARLQTKGCIDSAIFIERCNRNNHEIEKLRCALYKLRGPDKISNAIDKTKLLIDLLDGAQPMLKFEPTILQSMVKEITAYPQKLCFHLMNGLILEERRVQ